MAAQDLQARVPDDQYLELRYEDLVSDVEATLQQVCDFLNEAYTADMLYFYKSRWRYPTDARNRLKLTKPVIKSNVNKWPRLLSQRQLRIFEAVAGDTLEAYGYRRACSNPSLSEFERRFCTYVEHPAKKIVPLIKNWQSQVDLVMRCGLYLRLRAGL